MTEKLNIKEWLDENADVVTRNITDIDRAEVYVSKIDGSYLTFKGMEGEVEFLSNRGLTKVQNRNNVAEHTANIGFNADEKKWYGWSHRAMYGFGIGSTVKKGDCAYEDSKGEWSAETLNHARQMACDFAEGVS